MAIEKVKKIIFTLICIVLVASVGVVAYAAWDDVTGKKTGDLGVNTGDKTVLSCTVTENTTVTGKYLVPFGTVNFVDDATKNGNTNYFSWKVVPKLSDTAKKDPLTGNAYKIKYEKLTIEVKDKSTSALKASTTPTGNVKNVTEMFSFWMSTTAPSGSTSTAVVAPSSGTINVNGVFASGTTYYFVIRFKDEINANNVEFSNCTIDISIDLLATGA